MTTRGHNGETKGGHSMLCPYDMIFIAVGGLQTHDDIAGVDTDNGGESGHNPYEGKRIVSLRYNWNAHFRYSFFSFQFLSGIPHMTRLISLLIAFLLAQSAFGQDSLNVTKVGFYDTPGNAWGVAVSGNYAYVADDESGLRIINITNPALPTEAGFYDTPGYARSVAVAVQGNYAYLSIQGSGLHVIDVANPAEPTETGFMNLEVAGSWGLGVAMNGNYAYVTGNGLHVIDVSNPASLLEVGFFSFPIQGYGVAISGANAYIAFGSLSSSLRVVSISIPASPIEVGFHNTTGFAFGVAVSGDIAYVAESSTGLRLVNIVNPTTPVLVGISNTPGQARGVAIMGGYAYVADESSGLRVINTGNPAAPTEEGFYNTLGNATGIAVSGNFAYVADWDAGLGIYDISYFVRSIDVLYPIGGERLREISSDTIRWTGVGFEGGVSIALNRHYPIGPWEVIASETENDGEYSWFVTDPLSDSCRIRICAVQDTFCDISDGNFSIVSSQGYLALVKPSAPNSPVLSWNAGVVECPASQNEWFRLKNFGSEAVVVFQPLEPTSSEFSRSTECGSFFALAPNQMSACSLQLSFAPSADGEYYDTLRVQTDAVNGDGGYVKIPLSGEQISTPASPQVVILPQDEDVTLYWSLVDTSLGGCAVSVERYLVFYSPTEAGPYYYHGWTSGTSYTHAGVVTYAQSQFYQVVAVDVPAAALANLREGMEMGEALGKIPNRKFQFTVQK